MDYSPSLYLNNQQQSQLLSVCIHLVRRIKFYDDSGFDWKIP